MKQLFGILFLFLSVSLFAQEFKAPAYWRDSSGVLVPEGYKTTKSRPTTPYTVDSLILTKGLSQTAAVGAAKNIFSGKTSIGGTHNISKLSVVGTALDTVGVSGITKTDATKWWLPMFNITNGDRNLTRDSLWSAIDTSSFSIQSTKGGKMRMTMKDSIGGTMFQIDSSGCVGIGDTAHSGNNNNTYGRLSIYDPRSNGSATLLLHSAGQTQINFGIDGLVSIMRSNGGNGLLYFKQNGTIALTLNNGKQSFSGALFVADSVGSQYVNFGNSPNNSGYALSGPNTAGKGGKAYEWQTFSDGRIKSNQTESPYGLSTVLSMQPKKFFQHNSTTDTLGNLIILPDGKNQIGFIAQELENLIPEVVTIPNNPNELRAVDYPKLCVVLTKAIQELNTKVNTLEKRIETLENK